MTITIVGGGNPSGPTFPVQRSVRLRASNTAYFNRTPASAGNQQKFTFSCWIKRGLLSSDLRQIFGVGTAGNSYCQLRFNANDTLYLASENTALIMSFTTSQVFRDPSAWYHIVLSIDTTQATDTNRVKIYVNGVQVTAFSSTPTYPAQNTNLLYNSTAVHYIGTTSYATTSYLLDGYLTEVNFVNDQNLTPTAFGAYNSYGVWSPSKYSGTYGTNGFYLNFQDNSNNTATTIGKDSSGNNNNWAPNGIVVSPATSVSNDSMLDVPTLTSTTNANFATLNPLRLGSVITASAGNLQFASSSGNSFCSSTIGMTAGKWYCEIFMTSAGTAALPGIVNENATTASYPGGNANGYGYFYDGNKYTNGAGAAYGSSYTTNDIIGIAFDFDNGKVWFSKNGVWQASGDPAAGTNAAFTGISLTNTWFFACGNSGVTTQNINFGQRPFTHPVPTGFKSLNTYNLPAPTIPNGATQFAATTYTGTAASLSVSNAVNGKSFQPDFIWFKSRSSTASHALFDSVRGRSKGLTSNATDAEQTSVNAGDNLVSFDSGGFTVGSVATVPFWNSTNGNTLSLVGWQWKANGTPAVTNTSGTIPSTISVNTTAGFSIVTYTGTLTTTPGVGAMPTVGHGLNAVPKLIISKSRNVTGVDSGSWAVFSRSIATDSYLRLNTTAGTASVSGGGGGTMVAPTSSVFSTPYISGSNINANNYVAYCFSEIPGFSKFGDYTGNGSTTDGPFVYCGFRPRWIMVKRTDATGGDWQMYDTSQNSYNVGTTTLAANSTGGNGSFTSGYNLDFLSNGFKWRSNGVNINASTISYIFAAFAENPFNYSLAR